MELDDQLEQNSTESQLKRSVEISCDNRELVTVINRKLRNQSCSDIRDAREDILKKARLSKIRSVSRDFDFAA